MGVYAGGVAGAEPQPVHYTVAPGDTLWGIAIEHTAVWEDPRPKVEAIREANDLSGYEIYPGMSLKVPSKRHFRITWEERAWKTAAKSVWQRRSSAFGCSASLMRR